jgi:hypothetical protein
MAVTIGTAGITFNDATVQATKGLIRDSNTSTTATDYEIGVTILVSGVATTVGRNASVAVYYDTSDSTRFSLTSGTQLTGTWRGRGTVFIRQEGGDTGGGGKDPTPPGPVVNYYVVLLQRVA